MQRGLHEKTWQYVCGEQWEPSAPCCNHWSFAVGITATASANEAAEGQHWRWLNAFLYRSIKIKDAPPKATEKPKTPVPTEKVFLIVPVVLCFLAAACYWSTILDVMFGKCRLIRKPCLTPQLILFTSELNDSLNESWSLNELSSFGLFYFTLDIKTAKKLLAGNYVSDLCWSLCRARGTSPGTFRVYQICTVLPAGTAFHKQLSFSNWVCNREQIWSKH